jgi:hypothetical protein
MIIAEKKSERSRRSISAEKKTKEADKRVEMLMQEE